MPSTSMRTGRMASVDFAVEVYSAVDCAAQHPKAWPVLEGEVRRCQTKRYPYGVLYSEEAEGLFVLAVMHLHRDPDYWKHRLELGPNQPSRTNSAGSSPAR